MNKSFGINNDAWNKNGTTFVHTQFTLSFLSRAPIPPQIFYGLRISLWIFRINSASESKEGLSEWGNNNFGFRTGCFFFFFCTCHSPGKRSMLPGYETRTPVFGNARFWLSQNALRALLFRMKCITSSLLRAWSNSESKIFASDTEIYYVQWNPNNANFQESVWKRRTTGTSYDWSMGKCPPGRQSHTRCGLRT